MMLVEVLNLNKSVLRLVNVHGVLILPLLHDDEVDQLVEVRKF